MSDLWDWEHTGYANDEASAVFKCRGWENKPRTSKKYLNKNISLSDIPEDARKTLAKEIKLDAAEFDHWGHDLKTYAGTDGIYVEISVPNVWICADLLRGGSWYSDKAVFGVAGSLGQIPTQLFTWKHKIVKCESFNELQVNLGKYQGKLWGMVLFAHGNELGIMTQNKQRGTELYNQSTIMLLLAPNRYKLAKISMMQCYSGYRGTVSIKKKEMLSLLKSFPHGYKLAHIIYNYSRDKFPDDESAKKILEEILRSLFQNQEELKILEIKVNEHSFEVRVKVDWDINWHSYGIDVKVYHGMNVMLIDTGDVKNWF